MASQVVAFLRRSRRGTDWSQEEIAELYRIEHALLQARFSLETDRGVSDEGDPWFVFCRADGEVLVHITRSDEGYLLYGLGLPRPLTGRVIGEISKSFVNQIPLNIPVKRADGPQLFVHPAAALAIIVGMIFLANDDVALVSNDQVAGAPDSEGAAPVDRTVKASVLAVLGKFADGTLFGGERLETNHQEGTYLNLVCTIAAVMMGASVALDAGTQDFSPSIEDTVADASVEPAQAHQASPDVVDSYGALRSEASVGNSLSADRVAAMSSSPEGDTPLQQATVHSGTATTQDSQQQKAAIDSVANLDHQRSDPGVDETMFGLPRPMVDTEAKLHTETGQHAEPARPSAAIAPPPVTTAASEVNKQATSEVAPSKTADVHHEDAGVTAVEAPFHDLFKSVGLSDSVQIERVVTHATLDILKGFGEPLVVSVGKVEPLSFVATADHVSPAAVDQDHISTTAAGKDQTSAETDVAAGAKGADVNATAADVAQGKLYPSYDLAARETLLSFFQENPNAQAIFYQGNAVVFDADDHFASESQTITVWETDAGATITLVGHVHDLAVHV